jgi:RimJ/RimL family protein N-acetyltransferase
LAALHKDSEVAKCLTGGAPPTVDIDVVWRNIAMMVGHWHLRGYGHWLVADRASEQVVGRVGFWYPSGWPGVELSWLIRRSEWNRGLATEAARAALAWAWQETAVQEVISLIRPENHRSIRVAEKLGQTFRRETVLADAPMLEYAIARPPSLQWTEDSQVT